METMLPLLRLHCLQLLQESNFHLGSRATLAYISSCGSEKGDNWGPHQIGLKEESSLEQNRIRQRQAEIAGQREGWRKCTEERTESQTVKHEASTYHLFFSAVHLNPLLDDTSDSK